MNVSFMLRKILPKTVEIMQIEHHNCYSDPYKWLQTVPIFQYSAYIAHTYGE